VDIPLNPVGLAQAHAAAAKLRHRGIASIVASPLSRARATADIVGAALGAPVRLDDALREGRFGVQEGQPMAGWFAAWVDGAFTPQDGEPFDALCARAVAAVNRALELPAPLLIVGHGAFFRGLRAAMGLERNQRMPNATPVLCEPDDAAWRLTAV
jgi:probable phosphoglycerate mutase